MELIMSRINELTKEFFSVLGDPWHGSSVQKILEDITEEQAFSEPIPNAHNILKLYFICGRGTEEIISRLEGNIRRIRRRAIGQTRKFMKKRMGADKKHIFLYRRKTY
jgi:hypothetical protein